METEAQWHERLCTRGKPTAVVIFDDAGNMLGIGSTLKQALKDAHSYLYRDPCPFCGVDTELLSWRAYPLDSLSCKWMNDIGADGDTLKEARLKWYEERGSYLWTMEATCIKCRGESIQDVDCDACEGQPFFTEGIKRDTHFPDARHRIDIIEKLRMRRKPIIEPKKKRIGWE
jgi:hypothetical protein